MKMARFSPQPPSAPRSAPLSARTAPHVARSPPLPSEEDLRQPASARARLGPLSLERILDREQCTVSTFLSSDSVLRYGEGKALEMGKSKAEVMPSPVLFPSDKPSSRADAIILDQWVTKSLQAYATRAPGSGDGEDDITTAVEHLVPILSIGLNEVVRQVTQSCTERGIVLEKIWRTYVELFDRALKESRNALRKHKERTGRVEAAVDRTHRELAEVQERNPEQVEKLSKTLAEKFAGRVAELEEHLQQLQSEKSELKKNLEDHHRTVQSWFPRFEQYKACEIAKELAISEAISPESSTPEASMAQDFKRILATLSDERRRRVGFFVSSLLGLRAAAVGASQETIDALMERRDHNRRKIAQLEHHLNDLRKLRLMQSQNNTAAGAAPAKRTQIPTRLRHSRTSI